MSYFVKPNKRGTTPERCEISAQIHSTSCIFSIGPKCITIDITLPNGSKGFLEMTEGSALKLADRIHNLLGNSRKEDVKILVNNKWAAEVLELQNKPGSSPGGATKNNISNES